MARTPPTSPTPSLRSSPNGTTRSRTAERATRSHRDLLRCCVWSEKPLAYRTCLPTFQARGCRMFIGTIRADRPVNEGIETVAALAAYPEFAGERVGSTYWTRDVRMSWNFAQ